MCLFLRYFPVSRLVWAPKFLVGIAYNCNVRLSELMGSWVMVRGSHAIKKRKKKIYEAQVHLNWGYKNARDSRSTIIFRTLFHYLNPVAFIAYCLAVGQFSHISRGLLVVLKVKGNIFTLSWICTVQIRGHVFTGPWKLKNMEHMYITMILFKTQVTLKNIMLRLTLTLVESESKVNMWLPTLLWLP